MPYWDERFAAMGKQFPAVKTDQYHIDGLTIQMVLNPQRFDVIVASNLFGDILSDLGPATAGTIGIAPSANMNPERAFPSLFEPVHGSAPDIYGKAIANPIGQIWSGAMMLSFSASAAGAPSCAPSRACQARLRRPRDARDKRALAAGPRQGDRGGCVAPAATLDLERRSSLTASHPRGTLRSPPTYCPEASMKCVHCLHDNRAAAKFCEQCGAPLGRACVACGVQLSMSAKFCPECGCQAAVSPELADGRFVSPDSYTPRHLAEKILTSRAALEGERKQVTVLFADLKGSMELLADQDPEEARQILDPVLELMLEAVHHYEGTVNQVMGDGVMALFGAPLAHEDHAVRACYAALRMQDRVQRHADEIKQAHGIAIRIRIGLNSGEVVVRSISNDLHMDYTAVGQTTHLAARMEQMAEPGSILAPADTLRLVEGYVEAVSLGPRSVRGRRVPPLLAAEAAGHASDHSLNELRAWRAEQAG
jgi:class 3 adenylate cyclase